MKEADYLLKWTDELKNEIEGLPYEINDIRKDFFGFLYDVAYSYYRSYILIEFSYQINNHEITFDKNLFHFYKHVERVSEITEHQVTFLGYYNSLNRGLLISAWSCFELCVTLLCESLCNNTEKEKLLKHQFNEITNLLKDSKITQKELHKIEKKISKDFLTHVPINRKYDFLFKKTNNYKREKEKDRCFLEFFGKFRNTIHTNFLYYGKDYNYEFGEYIFSFRNQKVVKWSNPNPESPILYFNLMTELKEIWKEIISNIEHKEVIPYPDPEQA